MKDEKEVSKIILSFTINEDDNSSFANDIRKIALTGSSLKIESETFSPYNIAKSKTRPDLVSYQFLQSGTKPKIIVNR